MTPPKKKSVSPEQIPEVNRRIESFRNKFEVFGEEMIEKEVKQSGNSGRVYLPPEWVGKHVKIIRMA
ncbi:MAG: hypothetical protein C0407_05330 [Desulfobacca sp.]|nr:hypothetical protein [Desulfobacca sp.]